MIGIDQSYANTNWLNFSFGRLAFDASAVSMEERWSRVWRCFWLILADMAKPRGMINTQQQLQFNFGFRNCLADSAMVECSLKCTVCVVIPLVGCNPLAMPFCGLCPVEDTHQLFIIMQIYSIDCWLLLGIISTVLSFFQWRVIYTHCWSEP